MPKLNVTITVPMDINIEELDGVTVENVERHFNKHLATAVSQYPGYSILVVTEGFARCVRTAIKSAIEEIQIKQCGRSCIEYHEDGTDKVVAWNHKWRITSLNIYNKLKLVLKSPFTGKVESI